jgi:hypothetical protein
VGGGTQLNNATFTDPSPYAASAFIIATVDFGGGNGDKLKVTRTNAIHFSD